MNYNIDTEEGMANAVRWMEQTLATPSKTLIWLIPRAAATYNIDKSDRTFTRTGMDEPTDRVLLHMGFAVKEIQ
jgi:hypothetical protein